VAFYLYVLQPIPTALSIGLLFTFALLTFVPTRYLYLSQRSRLNRITNFLAIGWTLLVFIILIELPVDASESRIHTLALASLFFPLYYLTASWIVSARLWSIRKAARRDRMDAKQ
jgi:hypothetical protein